MSTTLFWHDYETSGLDPRRDRPVQFAGLRTDEALNEIGEPLVLYCKPTLDMLPQPESCLLIGITPQQAERQGVPEPEFIARIHTEMARPGTCSVGYNTLQFDDEVTRHTLYRNFYDPYAREWKQGNSRWDIVDLTRMAGALRPEGIVWPRHGDDRPSFRLQDLATANGLNHESAHDALSDVRATIELARLLRNRQPRLYEWLFRLRSKKKVAEQLDLVRQRPVLHTSRIHRSATGCTTLVMPLLAEPGNGNSVLVYDLRQNPDPFLDLDEESLHDRLFTRNEDLPEGVQRLPVSSVKINKCPALAPRNTLDEPAIERIGIDLDACDRHWAQLKQDPGFARRVARAYSRKEFSSVSDVDLMLYDGFFSDADRSLQARVRGASAQTLKEMPFNFRDRRLPEMLFRYRARHWPETLSEEDRQRWEVFRSHRLRDADGGGSITLADYCGKIARLRTEREGSARDQRILDALESWGERVSPAE